VRSSREDFLVPVRALSVIFRAKFRDLLKKTELFDGIDQQLWKKEWVVHSEQVGSGEAAFKYLAPYIFRVAISNSRIIKLVARSRSDQLAVVDFGWQQNQTGFSA
jgi:hypothetical protein